MIALDEILYNAIAADAMLMQLVGGRVKDVVFETGDDGKDNVPLPYIVVIDGGSQEQPETKDCQWDPSEDHVQAGIEVSAESPREVRSLVRKCRKAVARYIKELPYNETPYLESMQRDGVAWDWTKPCYFDILRYNCAVPNDTNDTED